MKQKQRLIIFTRYPDAGKVKTRLLPALGPEGAATLYRQMAEHTVWQARFLSASEIVVCFTGGTLAAMQDWLGSDLSYQPQAEGDLGDRMVAAFADAFQVGCTAVVIIGTDCPDLDSTLLQSAFTQLQSHTLVLGAATDGGYYLVGLRQPQPELFQGIAWSTEVVRQQTIALAEQLQLKTAILPLRSDVDIPADLDRWYRVCPTISVIIPVRNEAQNLAATLQKLTSSAVEIIVVDGGSQDETVAIAQQFGVIVLTSPPGRAQQMNLGAQSATGEILLFLHGDTQVPAQFDHWIRHVLQQPQVVAGAFDLKIAAPEWGLRLVEWGVRQRSRWLQLPYGDQGIFLPRSRFWELGGFPHQSIMEDVVLMQRLRQQGQIAIVPVPVLTSARRWQRLGILRTTLLNQAIVLGYGWGISPDRLARWYHSP